MTRCSTFILLLTLQMTLHNSASAEKLSLTDAIQRALDSNREIKASSASVEAAKSSYDGAIGKYLPSLELSANSIHLNKDINIDLSDLRTAIIGSSATAATVASGNPAAGSATASALQGSLPAFELPVLEQNFTTASINLTQPIFTGGKITANKNAKAELYESSKTEEADTQSRILVELVQQYFMAQLASEVKNVRQEALSSLQEHQRIADALLAQGQLSKAQKMKVDVALADAETALSKSARDEQLARQVLANTLDRPAADFTLTSKLRLAPLESQETYASAAQDGNYGLKQIQHKKKLLAAKETAAYAEYMPTIALVGSYEVYKKNLSDLTPQWFAGIGLKMNIFKGLSDRNDIRAIGQEKVVVDFLEGNAKSMVSIGVEKFYAAILNAKDEYQAIQKTKSLAQESLRLNTAAFRNGFAKSTDIIDSQLQLTAVQLNELKALYDYNSNFAQLLRFSGKQADIPAAYRN